MRKKILLFSARYGEHIMETEVWRAAYPETLGETLGPRFDLVSDLVLVQLENIWKTWKLQIIILPHKENRLFKSHSLCLCQEKPETRV